MRGAVTDAAGMLGDGGYAAQIVGGARIERDVDGSAVRVVTVDDVDAESPKAFATRLFNRLALSERTENGVLVLVVKDQRRVEWRRRGPQPPDEQRWCAAAAGRRDPRVRRPAGRASRRRSSASARPPRRRRRAGLLRGVGGLELAGYGILLAATLS